jgi:purine-nucleoside phosphorylase
MSDIEALILSDEAQQSAALIRKRIGTRKIDIAFVLGTGLGPLADALDDAVVFPYADLPGFPGGAGVTGHAKRLLIGTLEGKTVAMLQGRAHYYEHGDARAMMKPLETMVALGIEKLFLTNSAGSLREEWGVPAVVAISDHIAFSGQSPLIGIQGDRRFVPLVDCYDPALRNTLQQAAQKAGIALPQGVYMWFSGPAFETPAEIRMAKTLGADLIGMSTVPETILARYMDLQVVALSSVTNLGAGIGGANPSHAETKEYAARLSDTLQRLIRSFMRELP